MEIIYMIAIIFAILQIILFFKIWGMTNHVRKMASPTHPQKFKEYIILAKEEFKIGNEEKAKEYLLRADVRAHEELSPDEVNVALYEIGVILNPKEIILSENTGYDGVQYKIVDGKLFFDDNKSWNIETNYDYNCYGFRPTKKEIVWYKNKDSLAKALSNYLESGIIIHDGEVKI